MKDNFETVLDWVLVHEGGYVNHPRDPGGATNLGVTERTYDAWRTRQGLPPRSVRLIDEAEVREIYRTQYWDAVRGDELPAGVDYAVFDFAVNSGPSRAAKFLQRAVGAAADGVVGEITLMRVGGAARRDVIHTVCERRLAWMQTLRTWPTFGRGWKRRVVGQHDGVQDDDTGVLDRAAALSRQAASPFAPHHAPIPAPRAAAPGKARDEDLAFWPRTFPCLRAA